MNKNYILIIFLLFFGTIYSQNFNNPRGGSGIDQGGMGQDETSAEGEKKQEVKEGMEMPVIDDLMDSVMVDRWKLNKYNYKYTYSRIDTGLIGIQKFEKRFLNGEFFHNRLGEVGHATNTYIFSEDNRDINYLPLKNYRYYIANDEKLYYFSANYPYSMIEYYGPFFKSSPLAKTIRVEHGQHVIKNWVVGFSGEYFNYESLYENQETQNTQLSIFSSFKSEKYDNHFSFNYTTHDLQESGGLTNDTLSQDAKSSTARIKDFKRNIENFNWALDQIYRTEIVTSTDIEIEYDTIVENKLTLNKDTLELSDTNVFNYKILENITLDTIKIVDSVGTKFALIKIDSIKNIETRIDTNEIKTDNKFKVNFIHNFDYENTYNLSKNNDFSNNDNLKALEIPYYEILPKNLFDSSGYTRLSNKISVQIEDLIPRMNLQVGIEHAYESFTRRKFHGVGFDTVNNIFNPSDSIITKVKDDSTYNSSSQYNDFTLSSSLNWDIPYLFKVDANLEYQFSGFKKNRIDLTARATREIEDINSSIYYETQFKNRPLSYFEKNSPTAVYSWNKSGLEDEILVRNTVGYKYQIKNDKFNFHISPSITNMVYNDYYYFNEKSLPEQTDVVINEFALESELFWNKLHFYTKAIYQKPDNDKISVPEFNIYSSLSYQFRFYTMRIRPGIDFRMHTKYYAPAYNPLTSQFINQRNKEYGNWPYMDLFVNFKLAQVRFFVKLDNFYTLFKQTAEDEPIAPNYFNAYRYPYDGLPHSFETYRLKVGIIWKLFN
jgi:hypothetical protein